MVLNQVVGGVVNPALGTLLGGPEQKGHAGRRGDDDDHDDDKKGGHKGKGKGKGHKGDGWLPPGQAKKLEKTGQLAAGVAKNFGGGEQEQALIPAGETIAGGGQQAALSQISGNDTEQALQTLSNFNAGGATQGGPVFASPTGTSIGSQLLNRGFQAQPGSQIIGPNVLSAAQSGDTAGFIESLAGNIQQNQARNAEMFFRLTS